MKLRIRNVVVWAGVAAVLGTMVLVTTFAVRRVSVDVEDLQIVTTNSAALKDQREAWLTVLMDDSAWRIVPAGEGFRWQWNSPVAGVDSWTGESRVFNTRAACEDSLERFRADQIRLMNELDRMNTR